MKYLVLILILIVSLKVESQNRCECCAYFTIEFNNDFDDFFKSDIIAKQNIRTAIISTTENSDSLKNKFIQAKFHFDKYGRIKIKKIFSEGHAQIIIDYDRNEKGQIIKTTENYMDSLENRSNFMEPKINDYNYNGSGKLIKTKQRGDNGEVVQDNVSEYTSYEYDKLKRVVREYRYSYYGKGQIHIYDTKFSFDSLYVSTSITKYNDKPWHKITTKYDKNYRILNQIDYSLPDLKMLGEQQYDYNDINQVIRHFNSAGLSECPERRGNVVDEYLYNSNGLLEKILHKFGKVICEMDVTYE